MLRAAVAAHGSQAGLSDGRTRDLVLAVHELAANAVRHGRAGGAGESLRRRRRGAAAALRSRARSRRDGPRRRPRRRLHGRADALSRRDERLVPVSTPKAAELTKSGKQSTRDLISALVPSAKKMGGLGTPIDVPLDPARVEAAHEAGRLLESLGHHVEEAQAPWREDTLLHAFTALFAPLVTLQIAFGRLVGDRRQGVGVGRGVVGRGRIGDATLGEGALAAIAATKVRVVTCCSSIGSKAVAPIQRPNVAGDVEGGGICLLAAAPDPPELLANVRCGTVGVAERLRVQDAVRGRGAQKRFVVLHGMPRIADGMAVTRNQVDGDDRLDCSVAIRTRRVVSECSAFRRDFVNGA